MAKIPQETIDSVRGSADIVDIVSQEVDLRLRGANYFGLCPFHDEKTPSFSVSTKREEFHCFGCNANGDANEFCRLITQEWLNED